MKDKKNVSSLENHVLYKKKGKVVTPLNDSLGDTLSLNSWTKERMPEYIWLALILLSYGRTKGFEVAGKILLNISKEIPELSLPKLSKIFKLSKEKQIIIYKIIGSNINLKILSPLTIIYRYSEYQVFNSFFYTAEIPFGTRKERLEKCIKIFSPPQSNDATDLRFLALSLLLFGKKLHIAEGMQTTIDAFKNYPYTDHNEEIMRQYRPTIRSMEGLDFDGKDDAFLSYFWKELGKMTDCNLFFIDYPKNELDLKDYIKTLETILEYLTKTQKLKTLSDHKFDVLVGSFTFAKKTFQEIVEKDLGNSIHGRLGIRSIIEIYIISKYLLASSEEKNNIWEEYKLYGISKYKLVLLKARESELKQEVHFNPVVADAIVNEIKWEEFIDIDLKYFDKLGIRDKSHKVGEKQIYDIYYDYDSSYAHGLWGAIRESSMLPCDSASHQYHSTPDIYGNQQLPEVITDSKEILNKIVLLISNEYDIPEYLLKSMDIKNEE